MSLRVITSISSGIGAALARAWIAEGHQVVGTYRTRSDEVAELEALGATLIHCDMGDSASLASAVADINASPDAWEALVMAAGSLEPIGPFETTDMDQWERSIQINFTSQLRMVRELLPGRSDSVPDGPLVLFFAGGGTNNATVDNSAYTVSKIALIKMCELLDAEVVDTRFTIIGPGWVDTKIHQSVIDAGESGSSLYQRTVDTLEGNDLVPLSKVVDCCNWVFGSPRDVVGGRNFSLVHDDWGNVALDEMLRSDPNMYKLRRAGN